MTSRAVGVALISAAVLMSGACQGIDVSQWQHPGGASIDWLAVKGSDRHFVFIKATEGPFGVAAGQVNPYFASDWAGAGAAGLLRGAYHRARPSRPVTDSALVQARSFVAVTGSMQGGADLPPVLDIESTGGLSPVEMVAWIHAWLGEVERITVRRPIIYTGLSFWNSATGGSSEFAGYRLWFARYVDASGPGQLPTGFPTWTFWQQSDSGSVPGISGPVDLDQYCCGPENLRALAGASNGDGGSPFGNVDALAGGPDGTISIRGWSIDPDTPGPISTHVYVDGSGVNLGPTSDRRPDVAAAYGQFGEMHGFSWTASGFGAGPHSVCIYAINEGYGSNKPLRCSVVTVPGGSPIGVLDVASGGPDGTLRVAGWTLDPDVSGPIDSHVYIDGVGTNLLATNVDRPDVAAVFPAAYSATRGFDWTAHGLAPGPHQVCVFGINQGKGSNSLIRCVTAIVPGGSPFGFVDRVSPAADHSVSVVGWTVDPDVSGPIDTHVYIDGVGTNLGPADVARPDVAAAVPGYGANHGFEWTSGVLGAGRHTVCVFGIDVGAGDNALLECRTITT